MSQPVEKDPTQTLATSSGRSKEHLPPSKGRRKQRRRWNKQRKGRVGSSNGICGARGLRRERWASRDSLHERHTQPNLRWSRRSRRPRINPRMTSYILDHALPASSSISDIVITQSFERFVVGKSFKLSSSITADMNVSIKNPIFSYL
ncbi:F-box protein SKIP23-like [Iris pallida]|uniref:F-box protein SKIP23-like n=1 Tax=Iris pallida TaxID=29817 RepID=A0AAX6F638_IRIPA|nr:F-box protein SKIP23-like [Iris pallida]